MAVRKVTKACWIRSRGPGSVRDKVEVYVYGPTLRRDEGIVGHDLRIRPTSLGKGPYTLVVSPDDVEACAAPRRKGKR